MKFQIDSTFSACLMYLPVSPQPSLRGVGEALVHRFERVRPGPEEELMVALRWWSVTQSLPGVRTLWVGNGLTVGSGDPDLLIASYKPDVVKLRCLGDLSMSHARILALVRDGAGADWSSLVVGSGLPKREVESLVEGFHDIGAIRSKGRGFQLRAAWASILPETLAVEAKVSKWREALRQAIRNQAFTHRSYVALPAKLAKKVYEDPDFEFFGIGLLGVDESGAVTTIKKAVKKVPTLWLYHYYLAVMVAKSQEEVASCPSSYPLRMPSTYSLSTTSFAH